MVQSNIEKITLTQENLLGKPRLEFWYLPCSSPFSFGCLFSAVYPEPVLLQAAGSAVLQTSPAEEQRKGTGLDV